MSWPQVGALLSFCSAVLALLLLAIAPVGWRAGWWHFRFAFAWLMTSSGFAAVAAVIVSLLVLLFGAPHLEPGGLAMAAAALVLGAVLVYIPWQYNRLRNTVPRIHDITTDVENPPEFAVVLPARAAENAATADYEGAELAKLQRAAYPDVALAQARAMPGWSIVAADPATGRIEASQTSRWFGFTDDIVIRISGHGSGSGVDMRSLSRQGRSDFGVNAARIRAYMSALRKRRG